MKRTNGSIPGGDDPREALVAEAVDDFRERRAKGEEPDAEEYAARFPQIADELRRLLPALASLDAPPDAATPGAIGDFRIGREVGRGGMAIVYEAEQISLHRRVALKVLPFASVMDPRQLQRFKNEAQAAAHLHHNHIVPVHSIGCERGVHYYAMQFIEGMSVAQMIEELRAIASRDTPKESSSAAVRAFTGGSGARTEAYCRAVARLGIQAAEALDHAHQQGVVHRDIKPANLLVDASGHLWITDFGLASFTSQLGLTMTGDIVGTVRYMSPEQALAKRVPIDHRTDVYSLGVTLYELLTLETAFPGDDPHKVIQEIAFKEPTPARALNRAVPAELETILMKAMAKYPAERFGTAQEMADDLARYMRNEPIQARRPTLVQRAGKWARRHAALVWAAAVVLLLAVAGLATGATLVWREKARTEQQRDRAEANLGLALDALDKVYLNEAEITPTLRPDLSRDLLEKGLDFYERVAAGNRESLDVRRETGRALTRAGMIYRKLGQQGDAAMALDNAVACLREVVRERPEWAQAHASLGYALSERGQIDEAIAEYREAIRLDPASAKSCLNLGAVLCDQKHDYDGAIACFRRVISLEPDNPQAHRNIGVAHYRKGEFDDAVAACRQALRIQPDLGPARAILGAALLGKDQLDDAVAELREGIRQDPEFAFAHKTLGDALKKKGKLDDAIVAYREVVRLQPDDESAWSSLGIVLAERDLHDEAIAAFREAIRLAPDDAMARSNLGNALTRKGHLDEAITALREAVRLDPEYAGAHYNLGNALAYKDETDAAITEYREAIRLEPESAGAHGNLGSAFCRQGRFDDAITEYREAIRLTPHDARGHHGLANALAAKGDLDGAIPEFREALRLAPDSQAQNALAWLLATCPDEHLRNPAEALDLATSAAKLAPQDGAVLNTLGVAQYRAGHFKEAVEALEQSMRLRSGGDASDWLFVAMAKWRLGGRDAARAFYEKALAWMKEHAPDDPELKRFAAEAAELLGATKTD